MGGGSSEQAFTIRDEDKELANLHLRHAMLSSLHSHLRNFMLCMDRNYFGVKTKEETELTNNLRTTLTLVEAVMGKYYNDEAEILG